MRGGDEGGREEGGSHALPARGAPSGPWEKGTECVCSVLLGKGDRGSPDLHIGSSTGGLRKSGRGIRWRALEEREKPLTVVH